MQKRNTCILIYPEHKKANLSLLNLPLIHVTFVNLNGKHAAFLLHNRGRWTTFQDQTNPSCFHLVLGALSASTGKGDLHFIQTKSGHLQLIHEPYIFVTDSVRSGRTFWRCMDYAKRCRARITSKNNVLKVTNPVHNHIENHLQKITRKYELGEVVTCPSI